jgi:Domain of unknown function (DUF4157)
MKWPFARHAPPSSAPDAGGVGAIATADLPRPDASQRDTAPGLASSRRDWATLPPLKVAGARPINLTVQARAFTESLASQQVLVHSPRLEHVRHIDSPSGSFRGILAPAVTDLDGSGPDVQEPSPLPSIEHRHVAALSGEHGANHGLSAVDQLLAIGGPPAGGTAPIAPDPIAVTPVDEPGGEGNTATGARRVGLADSRRRGLGPAYHGPLPEAMRAERERDDGSETGFDGRSGVSAEAVPGDVRATMRDLLGVDIGDRLVHRGPAVNAEAEAMGAKAFTRDGQVFLHDDVGPLDQAKGRSTLAHELTHAAQQIVHGVLHDEASAAGQAMEAHAQRVEQFVRGDGGAIKPSPDLLHARPPATTPSADADLVSTAQQMMREMVDSGLAKSDGEGGIVFTMPPSSMTASAGTQRLAGDTPPAHGASQTHWNPLETFGNTLSQGFGNDMLTIAGSAFGFSDEFMGEQRHDLVGQDRQFRRDQTVRAYAELRMDHLRAAELRQVNDLESEFGVSQSTTLDDESLATISRHVDEEVTARITLLDEQSAKALEQLNQKRTAKEKPLLDVPDDNFNAALKGLFDDVESGQLPTEAAVLTMLAQPSTKGFGGLRSGSGPPSTTSPLGGAAKTTAATGTPSAKTDTHSPGTGTPSAHEGPGEHLGTDKTKDKKPEEHWRTDATMGGRFSALGDALVGDVANAEIGFFGSLLGFDDKFEKGLHDEVSGHHAATDTGGTTHPDAAHAAAATHPDATHAAHAHADSVHQGSEGHQAVDHIVGDPYALDELATRLYPNIRSRLRQELLIDRERAGLLADFR